LPFKSFNFQEKDFFIEEVPTTQFTDEDNNYLITDEMVIVKAKIKFENELYSYKKFDRLNIDNQEIAKQAIILLNHRIPYTADEIINNFGIKVFKQIR
jgi:hypothetical protein